MRVLLVDDNALLRSTLARSLQLRGLSVDEASGVVAANDLVAANQYDVVISDEEMEDGFGHGLLARVAALQPRCRRALMSGSKAPVLADEEVAWERFFEKPGALPALLTWVRNIAADS